MLPCPPTFLPIFLPGARLEESTPQGEDQFEVTASTHVEMRAGNSEAPYVQRKGSFTFRFALVYASLEDALPLVEELLLLAHRAAEPSSNKQQRAAVAAQLAELIRVSGWIAVWAVD